MVDSFRHLYPNSILHSHQQSARTGTSFSRIDLGFLSTSLQSCFEQAWITTGDVDNISHHSQIGLSLSMSLRAPIKTIKVKDPNPNFSQINAEKLSDLAIQLNNKFISSHPAWNDSILTKIDTSTSANDLNNITTTINDILRSSSRKHLPIFR